MPGPYVAAAVLISVLGLFSAGYTLFSFIENSRKVGGAVGNGAYDPLAAFLAIGSLLFAFFALAFGALAIAISVLQLGIAVAQEDRTRATVALPEPKDELLGQPMLHPPIINRAAAYRANLLEYEKAQRQAQQPQHA